MVTARKEFQRFKKKGILDTDGVLGEGNLIYRNYNVLEW